MPNPDKPVFDVILPAISGGWTREQIMVGKHQIDFIRPMNADALLDDPLVHQRHAQDGYMPYWAYLWPTTQHMVAYFDRHPLPAGSRTLELGCGIGLLGLGLGLQGYHVTITDYDPLSVELSLANARLNGLEELQGFAYDWRTPLHVLDWDVMVASDVLYERRHHEPVIELLTNCLTKQQVCYLGDPGRGLLPTFIDQAKKTLRVDVSLDLGQSWGDQLSSDYKTTLLRITRH